MDLISWLHRWLAGVGSFESGENQFRTTSSLLLLLITDRISYVRTHRLVVEQN